MSRHEVSTQLRGDICRFHQTVMAEAIGVVDPEGVQHHEFVDGGHGRKVDYDKIKTNTRLFDEWMELYARFIAELYADRRPAALLGMANGANRISSRVATILGGGIVGLTTEKVDKKTVRVDESSRACISSLAIDFVLTVEDMGTTGSTTATAVLDLRSLGVVDIEATNTHQRNPTLPRLDELGITYHSMIVDDSLPTYQPDECATLPDGYCRQGVLLIPHGT